MIITARRLVIRTREPAMEPDRIEYFRNLLQERINELLGEADRTRNVMTGDRKSVV